jgi:hypothetical protein
MRAPMRIGASVSSACWNRAVASVRAVAFWAAILLPLTYVPAAYGAMGLDGWSPLALIALHAACAVVGHEHNGGASHG